MKKKIIVESYVLSHARVWDLPQLFV
jgi:hypothetical protein